MITVVLCIVILCMRRCHRKGKFPVDDKVYYDLTDLNTDVNIDHNPSYVVTTPDTVEYTAQQEIQLFLLPWPVTHLIIFLLLLTHLIMFLLNPIAKMNTTMYNLMSSISILI